MLYASWRRTILVFTDRGADKDVESLSIGWFNYDGLFTVHRTLNHEQWEGLRTVVEESFSFWVAIGASAYWRTTYPRASSF